MFFEKTIALLQKDKDFETYDMRSKLLSFNFTFFELLTANRSYVLMSLKESGNQLKSLKQLSGLKSSYKEFVSEIIVKQLNAKWILIGDDFCYGAKRAGNFASLKAAGKKYGFEVSNIHTVLEDGERISSSALRDALANGDMGQVSKLLGRPYGISGHVIHGQQLGRTLGFPTLNLAVANHLHHRKPATTGIFTAQVIGLSDKPLPAVASLGVRPTVEDEGRVLLETHIFDYKQEVYGKLITVELLEKIRDEAKYPDLDTLTKAIATDAMHARNYFQKKAYA